MINIAVGALAILGSFGGGAIWMDNHFETRDHAAQTRSDDEESRIQSDIDLYTLKLNFLEQKQFQSTEDKDEIAYLHSLIAKLRDRLKKLND